jgi:iron complex outermembrane receptor protein
MAPVGSALPYAPEQEAVIGARFYKDIGEYETFFQGIFKNTGSRFNTLIRDARVELPSYNQLNLSAGFGKDQWQATFFINNATDSLGQMSAGSPDNVYRIVPTRPRTIGFRISYDYM